MLLLISIYFQLVINCETMLKESIRHAQVGLTFISLSAQYFHIHVVLQIYICTGEEGFREALCCGYWEVQVQPWDAAYCPFRFGQLQASSVQWNIAADTRLEKKRTEWTLVGKWSACAHSMCINEAMLCFWVFSLSFSVLEFFVVHVKHQQSYVAQSPHQKELFSPTENAAPDCLNRLVGSQSFSSGNLSNWSPSR